MPRLSNEQNFMGWTIRVVHNDDYSGIAFLGKDKIIVRDLSSEEEVLDQLKNEVRQKKSESAKSKNPNINISSVQKSSGVFNQAFTNFYFSEAIPEYIKIHEDGPVFVDILDSTDHDEVQSYKEDGFVGLRNRQWGTSTVYGFGLTPNQIVKLGLEFRGIYGIDEVSSGDPSVRRFRLTPEPIDFLEGKETKKTFSVPTFSVPTWISNDLNEARQSDLKYDVTEVKGQLDRVTVEVTNQPGSAWTRLGNELKKVRNAIKKLSEQEKTVSDKIRDKFPQIFDAEDEVLTRVVQTASIIATMTKAGKSERTDIDYQKIVEQILEMDLLQEQQKAILAIIKANTKTAEILVPSKLRISLKESAEKLKDLWIGFLGKIKTWAQNQDQKIRKIEEMLPEQLNEESVLSSWIEDLTYVPDRTEEGEGDVEMTLGNGRTYTVYNVPYGEFEDWIKSVSKGKYWHTYIKNSYSVR